MSAEDVRAMFNLLRVESASPILLRFYSAIIGGAACIVKDKVKGWPQNAGIFRLIMLAFV